MAFCPNELTESTLKKMVDNLLVHAKASPLEPKRSKVQEALAATLGWSSWHAAITAVKGRSEAGAPLDTAHWALPSALMTNSTFSTSVGAEFLRPDADPKVWRVKPASIAAHATLLGSEAVRRQVIQEVARLNPARPMLVLQGPLALPLQRWSGSVARPQALRDVLPVASAPAIINALVAELSTDAAHSLWAGRAAALLSSVVFALVWLRAHAGVPLTIDAIRTNLSFAGVRRLSERADLPALLRQSLTAYLHAVPGYLAASGNDQSSAAIEQHGYLQMQFTLPLDAADLGKVVALGEIASPAPAQVCLTLGQAALAGHLETGVQSFVEEWVASRPGGLVVVDGFTPGSALWEFLATRLPHWKEQKVGAWIGAAVLADLPPGEARERLLVRIGGRIYLCGVQAA